MRLHSHHQCKHRTIVVFQNGNRYYQFWSKDHTEFTLVSEHTMRPGIVSCPNCGEHYLYIARFNKDTVRFQSTYESILENPDPWIMMLHLQ